MRQRQMALAPPSPSRAIPRTHISGVDRKQQQRRLLEAIPKARLLDACFMDRNAQQTRLAPHADRGKLLLQLEVARGFALNATTALSNTSSRLIRNLPPLLGNRAQRVAVVQHRASNTTPSDRTVVRYPRRMIQPDFLDSMGYHDRATEMRRSTPLHHHDDHHHHHRKHSPIATIDNDTTRSSSPGGRASSPPSSKLSSKQSTMNGGDTALPPPSGGPVESAPFRSIVPTFPDEDAPTLSKSSRMMQQLVVCDTVALVCPHLAATGRDIPRLEVGGVVYPRESQCTPPPHLRRGDREFRLIEFTEEIEDLLKLPIAIRKSRQSENARPPTPVKGRSDREEEDTPKPEGLDDRSWGRTVRDPQAEAADRLRLRMESQQPIPSNTPINFSAAEHFIEAMCEDMPDEDDEGLMRIASDVGTSHKKAEIGEAAEASSPLATSQNPPKFARRKSTMNIPKIIRAIDPRDDLLLVLSVGVNGVHEGASALPYAHAESNALWFHTVMTRVGARTTLLRGYEATVGAIREAMGRMVAEAREASSNGRNAKLILYVSGKGRVTASGDVLFAPQDGCSKLNEDIELAAGQCVNLHEIASRSIGLTTQPDLDESIRPALSPSRRVGSPAGSHGSRVGSPASGHRSGSPAVEDSRWSFPVVFYDVVVDRCRRRDIPFVPPQTPADKLDFWRPKYYGGILALKHEGGTLSAACSARHHGLIVYYISKAAEGKLSGHPHIGSITHITQFVAQKLRSRTIPTMMLRCAGVATDFAQRTAEEIFHPSKTLFASAAAKREAKRLREKKPCRWTLTCEVSIEYRYNPNAFVTQLAKRLKELITAKHRPRQPNCPPLMLWVGMRRMEHRFYLPLSVDPESTDHVSTDVFRYELISAITRSGIATSGGSGPHYVEASLESIDNNLFEFMKGDHCVVAHSQGTGHNRWTHNPFISSSGGTDTMGSIRNHSDADLDFIYILSQCVNRNSEISVLSFLDEKHGCEIVTVHGSGSVNDLRKILKYIRMGSLDIKACRNCRILKVDVNGMGEEEEAETAAIVLVQKVIRRFLTRRVMTSRLAAAMNFYRTQQQSWVDCFDAFQEDLLRWYIDFKEESFVAVEAAQARSRREIRVLQIEEHCAIYAHMMKEWTDLQDVCRKILEDEELVQWWLIQREGRAWPLYIEVLGTVRECSEIEHMVRWETLGRHYVLSASFEERFQMRKAAAADYAAVLEATRPPRQGKLIKKQRTRFELPLERLVRH
jgi:hypothetical protein